MFLNPYRKLIHFDMLNPNTDLGKEIIEKTRQNLYDSGFRELGANYYINTMNITCYFGSIFILQEMMKDKKWGKEPEDFAFAFSAVLWSLSQLAQMAVVRHLHAEHESVRIKEGAATTQIKFYPLNRAITSPFCGKKYSRKEDRVTLSTNMKQLFDAIRARADKNNHCYLMHFDNLVTFTKMLEDAFWKRCKDKKFATKKNTLYVATLVSALNGVFFEPDENEYFYEKYQRIKDNGAVKKSAAFEDDSFGPDIMTIYYMADYWQEILSGADYNLNNKTLKWEMEKVGEPLFNSPDVELFFMDYPKWSELHPDLAGKTDKPTT